MSYRNIAEGFIARAYTQNRHVPTFNPLRIEDYKNFAMSQEKVVESEAIEKGLLVEATDHAQKAVRAVLEMNPDIAEQYTIEFE